MDRLTLDFVVDVVFDADSDKEELSGNIGKYFNELVAAGKDPAELLDHMLIPDMIDAFEVIQKYIPDFDLSARLTPEFEDIRYYIHDLVMLGTNMDRVAELWPQLLTLDQKFEYGVSPDLIVEGEEWLESDTALRLLKLGANPNKVVRKALLSVAEMIEFGVKPDYILRCAVTPHELSLVHESIVSLLQHGLDPLALISTDQTHMNTRNTNRMELLKWYDDHLELLTQYAKNKKSFGEKYFDFATDLIFGQEIWDADIEDRILLDSLKQPVKLGLIDLEFAVEYLYGIHEDYDEDDYPIDGCSILLQKDLVREELSA